MRHKHLSLFKNHVNSDFLTNFHIIKFVPPLLFIRQFFRSLVNAHCACFYKLIKSVSKLMTVVLEKKILHALSSV